MTTRTRVALSYTKEGVTYTDAAFSLSYRVFGTAHKLRRARELYAQGADTVTLCTYQETCKEGKWDSVLVQEELIPRPGAWH